MPKSTNHQKHRTYPSPGSWPPPEIWVVSETRVPLFEGPFFMRVPHYLGDLDRDPNFDTYPHSCKGKLVRDEPIGPELRVQSLGIRAKGL